MPSGPPEDDLESFTGDSGGAALLRQSLRAMADGYAGTPLGDRVSEVLGGRLTIRELAEDREFAAFTQRGMQAFDEQWQAMSPQERERATAEGQAYLGHLEDPRRGD